MLPGERDMKNALAAVGCATYRELTQQPRAVRDLFHADWTRRMQERCGIDPMRPSRQRVADLSEEAVSALIARYRAGESPRELADEFNVNERAVHRLMARKPTKLPPETEQLIVTLHAVERLPHAAIAERVGIRRTAVYPILKRHGYSGFSVATPRVQDKGAARAEIVRLHLAEVPPVEIAAHVGLSRQRIGQILKAEGLTISRSTSARLGHQRRKAA